MTTSTGRGFDQELGDARVRSISWTEEDLVLDLALPGLPARGRCLCFKWVSRLKIDFDYGEYVGQPQLFAADVQESEGGRWKVRLDFGAAPEGSIEFECNEISERSTG